MTRKINLIMGNYFKSVYNPFGLVQLTALGLFGDLPAFDQLENPKNNLATEIISEDGVVLGKYFLKTEAGQDMMNCHRV